MKKHDVVAGQQSGRRVTPKGNIALDNKPKRQQGRNFCFEVYLDSETQSWSQTLDWINHQCISVAWMCHDKDKFLDDTEDHKKGDIKKTHIHVLISYPTPRNLSTVANALAKLGITHVETCHDVFAYLIYMTHEEYPSDVKAHYSYDKDGFLTDDMRLKYISRHATHGKVDTMELFKLCNDWLDVVQKGNEIISLNNFCKWVFDCCPSMWQVVMDNREWTCAFLGLRNYSSDCRNKDYYHRQDMGGNEI